MFLAWSDLTPKQLCVEAQLHAADHNDGGLAFFDVNLAAWSLVYINPEVFGIFKSSEDASIWIQDEISFLKADGNLGRAKVYENMIMNGIQDPIIVGKRANNLALWDGFHRVAISMVRKETVLTIIGEYNE
jgi:hypothetical protein